MATTNGPLIIELMNTSGQALARGVAWTTTSSPVQRGAGGSEDSSLKRDGRGEGGGEGQWKRGGGAMEGRGGAAQAMA